MAVVPEPIMAFFDTPTPDGWVKEASARIPELLLDHANCELKAASTALGFLYRYPERQDLAQRMSRLAREELRHFEQVRGIMDEMGIPFERLSASRYAGGLREAVREEEPYKLLDMLLVGALIEARSCERFADTRAAFARQAAQVLQRPAGFRGSPLRALHCIRKIRMRFERGRDRGTAG